MEGSTPDAQEMCGKCRDAKSLSLRNLTINDLVFESGFAIEGLTHFSLYTYVKRHLSVLLMLLYSLSLLILRVIFFLQFPENKPQQ